MEHGKKISLPTFVHLWWIENNFGNRHFIFIEKEIIIEIGMFIDFGKIILQVIFVCKHENKEVILFPKEHQIQIIFPVLFWQQ